MSGRIYPKNGASMAASSDTPNTRKIIVVGDEGCGKTSLVKAFLGNIPTTNNALYMAREYMSEVQVQDMIVPIRICDIPATEAHRNLRHLCYMHAKAAILCFAIDDPESLAHAENRWLSEVRHCCMSLRYILVGLKRDLRADEDTIQRLDVISLKPVSYQQALHVKEKHNLYDYMECSVSEIDNVRDIFERAASGALGLQ